MPENEKSNNGQETMDRALAEAAEQHLAKESKLEVAEQGVYVQDLHRLSADELAAVRRYRDMTVFGGEKKPLGDAGTAGDLIVCDDMNIYLPHPQSTVAVPISSEQKPNGSLIRKVLPYVLTAALGGGTVGGGLLLLDRFLMKAPHSTTIEKKETRGFLIDLMP